MRDGSGPGCSSREWTVASSLGTRYRDPDATSARSLFQPCQAMASVLLIYFGVARANPALDGLRA